MIINLYIYIKIQYINDVFTFIVNMIMQNMVQNMKGYFVKRI